MCRRLSEKREYDRPSIPPVFEILNNKKLNNTSKILISKLKINGSFIISYKHPNNIVLLQDTTIFRIEQIVHEENNSNQIKIKGVKATKTKNIYKYPTNSCDLQMCEILEFSSNVKSYPTNLIKQKCVILRLHLAELKPKRTFVLSLLHQ